jgi:P450-derived glycosyltransferase activator
MTTVLPTEALGPGPARRARNNQLTRAAPWFAGIQDDPYGLLLRAGAGDPHRHEERIRAQGPLYRSTLLDTWVTADRAVADTVVTDPAFDAPGPGGDELPYRSTTLALNRAHTARLAPLTALGGPVLWGGEECVEKRTVTFARTILADLGDRFDLAEDFARRLVGRVLAEQLSLPEAVYEHYARLLGECRTALDGLLCPQPHPVARAAEAAEAQLAALLDETLGDAGGDAVQAARVVSVGAAETTAVLLTNAVRAQLARPGAWQALAADPALAGPAVDATLRCAPPVRLETRTAPGGATLAGTDLPAGSRVTVLVAAVNRAPHTGSHTAPLGLPADLHFALSAPLIKTVARAALGALAAALPQLSLGAQPVTRPCSPVLNAPARLPAAKNTGRPGHHVQSRTGESLPCAS